MSGFQSQPINHIRGGCRWSCRSATEAAPLSLPLPLPPLSSGLDTINSSETDRAAIMAATGTETSGMQASCKSTELTRNTQDRLPTSLSLLYSRVKGHGVPPLRAKAAKHCHKTPQSFTTEEKTGGGEKNCSSLFLHHIPPRWVSTRSFWRTTHDGTPCNTDAPERSLIITHMKYNNTRAGQLFFIKAKSAVKVGHYERAVRREGGTGDGKGGGSSKGIRAKERQTSPISNQAAH